MVESSSNLLSKIVISVLLGLVAAVAGYFMVYYWVFQGFSDVASVSSLKNQVVSVQKANDVVDQLKSLGYSFDEEDFHQLNSPSTTNYRANVLDGYEPQLIENEEVGPDGYYFYDESGMAYYFTVDANNQIDPESMIPLISE